MCEKRRRTRRNYQTIVIRIYTLEYTRPAGVASVQSVCIVEIGVSCANSGMNIRHTQHAIRNAREGCRERERDSEKK